MKNHVYKMLDSFISLMKPTFTNVCPDDEKMLRSFVFVNFMMYIIQLISLHVQL